MSRPRTRQLRFPEEELGRVAVVRPLLPAPTKSTVQRDNTVTHGGALAGYPLSLRSLSSCNSLLCCAKIVDRSSGTSFTGVARHPVYGA